MQATPPPIPLTLKQVETTLRVLPSKSHRSTEQVVTVKGRNWHGSLWLSLKFGDMQPSPFIVTNYSVRPMLTFFLYFQSGEKRSTLRRTHCNGWVRAAFWLIPLLISLRPARRVMANLSHKECFIKGNNGPAWHA